MANQIKRSRTQKEKDSYIDNTTDGGIDRRVQDVDGNIILDGIKTELGNISGGVSTPTILNIAIPNKDVEQTQVLPVGTKQFMIKARNNSKVQFSFTSGDSNITYITIKPGAVYSMEALDQTSSITLYYQASKDAEVLELLYWI